jgi:tetraacyldisaccharide 4'-kinase
MSIQHSIVRVMSGETRGAGAAITRGLLGVAEPIYRAAIGWRNRRFDRDPARARRLPRPVVSIGNLTTGGTGKTPIIRWLAAALRERGLGIGILSRGYKATPGALGDEQRMLLAMLGGDANAAENGIPPPIAIECDPDRFAAGQRVLARTPTIDLFLLDDGFQHRRLHRDLDIVLLHAAEPFGYGHLLPRGLLREPPASLKRAGAIVVTNVPLHWEPAAQEAMISAIRQWNSTAPIVFERHEPAGFRSAKVASSAPPDHALADLAQRRAYCFSGLGSPGGFEAAIRSLAGSLVGSHRFADHHDYVVADVAALQRDATAAGADLLVTTEKDWVKLASLAATATATLPIWRLDVAARFLDAGDPELLALVERTLGKGS